MIQNFTILGKTFSAYMICALIGIFVMGIYAVHRAKKKGIDDIDFTVMLLWAALGVLAGGHILFGITNIPNIYQVLQGGISWATLKQALLYFSGSVFYGGLIGAVVAGSIYAYKKKMPMAECMDIMAAGIPLFHFFGRVGCFLSGCCYGMEISNGIIYHHSIVESANGVPRLPVQLIEAAGNLVLFYTLHLLGKKEAAKGRLLYIYFICYGCMRFILEFFRGDAYRGIWFELSTSQWISIGLIIFALIKILLTVRKEKMEQ